MRIFRSSPTCYLQSLDLHPTIDPPEMYRILSLTRFTTEMGLHALFQRFFKKKKKRNDVVTKKKKTGAFDSRPASLRPPPFLVLYGSLGSEAESLNSQYVSEHSSIQTDIDDHSLIFCK